MTKISIIVPVYNVEKYIQKTFDSILNQTIGFENLEVIFVDDYSTDNSKNIIDNWAKEYNNVISIHLDSNSGYAGKPRNIGLKKASSNYVLFLDSDDYLVEDACERLYNICQDTKSDITIGGYTNVSHGKRNVHNIKGKEKIEICENPKEEIKLMDLAPAIGAKLFKKDLLINNNIEFHTDIPGQDLVFVCETYFNANSITFLNNYSVYNRLIRDGDDKSVSNNVNIEYLKKLLKAYLLVLKLCEKYEINDYMGTTVICEHFNYFLSRVNDFNLSEEEKKEVFTSSIYNEFKNSKFFKNNNFFEVLFNNLEEELYNNYKLINYIKKTKLNEKIIKDLKDENKKLNEKNKKLNEKNKKLNEKNKMILSSNSWKITKPLRKIGKIIK